MVADTPCSSTVTVMTNLFVDAHPEYRELLADNTDFDALRRWSKGDHLWRCPRHPATTWTASPNVLMRRPTVWKIRCPQCAAERNTVAATFPRLAQHAVGWNPATTKPGDVRRLGHDWRCPGCGHTVTANLARLTGDKSRVDDPRSIWDVCPRCSGRTLAAHPRLAAQLVQNGADGATDPGDVLATSCPANRDKRTLWRCEHCGDLFHVTVLTALTVDSRGAVLHRPCRVAPARPRNDAAEKRAARLRQFRKQQKMKELSIQEKAEARIAAIRAEVERREQQLADLKAQRKIHKQAGKKKARWY